jgi:ferredoxin-NADP reductase
VLLIAGGVGITPIRALFESLDAAPGQDVLLLYRARTPADILFHHELIDISGRRPGRRLQYLVGDQVGPFTPELFRYFAPNLHERDVYLCGPPGMARAVRQTLLQAGLPEAQLHEERFDL